MRTEQEIKEYLDELKSWGVNASTTKEEEKTVMTEIKLLEWILDIKK